MESKTERLPSPETTATDSGYGSPPESEQKEDVTNGQSNIDEEKSKSCSDCKEEGFCEKNVLDTDERLFDTFHYWRTPLLPVDLDAELLDDPYKGVTCKDSKNIASNVDNPCKLDDAIVNISSEQSEKLPSLLSDEKQDSKFSFSNDSDDSDDEDCHIPIYSLTDDPSRYHIRYHEDWQSKNDYQDLKLSSSFEEDLLIPDHIQPLPPQVSFQDNHWLRSVG